LSSIFAYPLGIVVSGNDRAWLALSVTKPEEESPDASQKNSTCEKPARFRQCDQADKKHSDHNDQPDRVARVKPCTAAAERNGFGRVGFGVSWSGLPNAVAPNVRRSGH
jgi:hypothetical protein